MQENYIKIPLELQEFVVESQDCTPKGVELTVKRCLDVALCPCCGQITPRIHSQRLQKVYDMPVMGRAFILLVKKRRFKCQNPECEKVFTEQLQSIGRYQRRTKRLQQYLYELGKNMSISAAYGCIEGALKLSYTSILRDFHKSSLENLEKRERLGIRRVGVDEFNIQKGHKYATAICDLDAHKVVEVINGRDKKPLKDYLSKEDRFSQTECFVIDMWEPYYQAIKDLFPDKDIVIDKFHVLRRVNRALDEVRKKLQQEASTNGYRRKIYYSRTMLKKAKERLEAEQLTKLNLLFKREPRLKRAYWLKEWLRDWYNTPKSYQQAKAELNTWHIEARLCGFEPFIEVAQTLERWEAEILNYFKHKVTNGYAEGVTNKIKVIKRVAYGFNNFENFRQRILVAVG